VFVFQFLRTASRKRINTVLIAGAVLLVGSTLVYFSLFSYFTYTTPGKKVRMVKGFVCTPMAAKVYKDACPDLGMDELNQAEYEAERLWTRSSILIARLGLTAFWLLTFLALSVILGSFLVYQLRSGSPVRVKAGQSPA
jgi:hypothetical protein